MKTTVLALHAEKTVRELLAEKKHLLEVISSMTQEKDGLLNKVRDLSKAIDSLQNKQKSPTRIIEKERLEVFTEIVDRSQGTPSKRNYSRSPIRMDVFIEQTEDNRRDPSPQVAREQRRAASRSNSRIRQRKTEDPVTDKENIATGNSEYQGRPLEGRIKKFIGAWNQVVDLAHNFQSLLRDYDKLNSQILKDKNRMEQLSHKKPDLTPYFKEIAKILATPPIEQLLVNKKELEDSESEHLAKSIGFFEKLCEDFGYIFGAFSEKLKLKSRDYIKWNKNLAAYCQKNYPQFNN